MKESEEFSVFQLKNGLRVVHKQVDRPIAHCGLMINAGTRDELEDEHGIAHFIEHAIFKGTSKRRSYHILNRLDSVGGEIDAYTTKETTCFYGTFLTEYYDRAIELISDISLNSIFPEAELEKEKEVVLDEINAYLDSPSDQIYDDFESQVFNKHTLGKGILGTGKSVKSFNKGMLSTYMNRLYTAENMVFSSVGNISAKRLSQKLEKHFESINTSKSQQNRSSFIANPREIIQHSKDTYQTHCMLGKSAYGANHPKRIGLILLNNILGGPAMNSILNLRIREKYGYTYNIESNYAIYSDSGLFSIYLASDPKYMDRCVNAVEKELKTLRNKKFSPHKLSLAKQQLKGQMAISRESNNNIMLSNAKSLLLHNKISSIENIHSKIEAITAEELIEAANEHLNPTLFDYLYFKGRN
ncbi:MAG: insulinase family protein [Flavobacteriales bacterium]|nr:insulinase family protein [Flavobacteriales bacterium]